MTNILVVDPLLECGVLVKGVLMGKQYGVSLSSDYDEAMQKLNTGLFDIICIDTDDTAHVRFLNQVKNLIPDVPAIALTEKQLPAGKETKIFSSIPKPLSIIRLTNTVKDAVKHLKGIRQKDQHCVLNLPAEITDRKTTLRCLMTDLGLQGALVRSDLTSDPEAKQFSSFFLKGLGEIATSILVKDSDPIKLNSQIAFTENRPDGNLKQAGLKFPSLSAEQRKLVEGLITQAA